MSYPPDRASMVKYVENVITAMVADTVCLWVQEAQGQASASGLKITKEEARSIVRRSVSRASRG
jgi:hypothetical protein